MSTFKVGQPCKYCQTVITSDMVMGSMVVCAGCGMSFSENERHEALVSRSMYFLIVVAILAISTYVFRDMILFKLFPDRAFAHMTEAQLNDEISVCQNIHSSTCLMSVYKRLHELVPDKIENEARYAFVLTELGEYKIAEPIYRDIVSKGWATYDLFGNYGLNSMGLDKTEEAIKWYEKSLAITPSLVDVTEHLADAYMKIGNKLAALSLLESFSKAYPTSEEALRPHIDGLRDSFKASDAKKPVAKAAQFLKFVGVDRGILSAPVRIGPKATPEIFQLDTGASLVTIPLADILKEYPNISEFSQPSRAMLADGRVVSTFKAIVPSLWLGPWEFKNVEVMYCKTCSRLIGMSLLKNVRMQIESKGGLNSLTIVR